MKKVKEKKCKNPGCGKWFTPYYTSLQPICSPTCALQLSRHLEKKRLEKNWREEKKALKDELKTTTDHENDLQEEINAIVRLIDYGQKCISCDNLKRAFAGHFHSVGANKSLRFHLHNIHVQDFNCNGERGGNIVAYGRGLINRYGKEYKEYVEYDLVRLYPRMGWTKNDLIGWTKEARNIRRELEKDKQMYSAEDRIKLRTEINARLGIYK